MNYEKLRCSKIEALVIFVTVNEMFLEATRRTFLRVFPNLDTQLVSGFQCFSVGLTQLFLIKSEGVPTPSVKRQRQRPIQVNGDFSQASTQASSGIFEVCRLPLDVFMP